MYYNDHDDRVTFFSGVQAVSSTHIQSVRTISPGEEHHVISRLAQQRTLPICSRYQSSFAREEEYPFPSLGMFRLERRQYASGHNCRQDCWKVLCIVRPTQQVNPVGAFTKSSCGVQGFVTASTLSSGQLSSSLTRKQYCFTTQSVREGLLLSLGADAGSKHDN